MLDWTTLDPTRWAAAAALVGGYAALHLWCMRRSANAHANAFTATQHPQPLGAGAPRMLVVHASQTGQAQALAEHAAVALQRAGVQVQLLALGQLQAAHLQAHTHSLWLLATCGEGDAPDSAWPFVQQLLAQPVPAPSSHTHHAQVLALGDSSYAQFCAFGQHVHQWLRQHSPSAELLCIDRMCPTTLAQWQRAVQTLAQDAGAHSPVHWGSGPSAQPWVLRARTHLNPGSLGQPIYQLHFTPADSASAGHTPPHWQAGDLVSIAPPADSQHLRDYSIASIPQEGELQLLVRQSLRADGSVGLCSAWLTEDLAIGEVAHLQLRAHPGFQLQGNAQRPVLLIGNGSGLAGLLSLLKARIADGQHDNWLLWGDRQAHCDALLDAPLQAWLGRGQLQRLDRAWSREQPQTPYVQHLLVQHAAEVQAWVQRGAAIYVCGSRQGMGEGVHQALQRILGDAQLQALQRERRYCRDLY